MAKEQTTDKNAPAIVTVTITGPDGKTWGIFPATAKTFSSGSVGYYANGKPVNPDGFAKYQLGCNITLIGSKGEK